MCKYMFYTSLVFRINEVVFLLLNYWIDANLKKEWHKEPDQAGHGMFTEDFTS